MTWSLVGFGKYKNNTLPQIICKDPDWFFWAMRKNIFKKKSKILLSEANDLNHKARNIKIPNNEDGNLVVEYYIHPPTRKFSHFSIVSSERPIHEGGSEAFRRDVIDMSIPIQISNYDKLGCKKLLKSLKYHVFGNSKARFTKIKCEKFFSDASNFA